jgi:hypothetical protein
MPKPQLTVRKGAFLFLKKPEVTLFKFARIALQLKVNWSKAYMGSVCLMI